MTCQTRDFTLRLVDFHGVLFRFHYIPVDFLFGPIFVCFGLRQIIPAFGQSGDPFQNRLPDRFCAEIGDCFICSEIPDQVAINVETPDRYFAVCRVSQKIRSILFFAQDLADLFDLRFSQANQRAAGELFGAGHAPFVTKVVHISQTVAYYTTFVQSKLTLSPAYG